MIRAVLETSIVVGVGGVVYFVFMPMLTVYFNAIVGVDPSLTFAGITVGQYAGLLMSAIVSTIVVIIVGMIVYLAASSQKDEFDSGRVFAP